VSSRLGVNQLYEALEALTAQMAAAARANRWQEVVNLRPGVAQLTEAIRAADSAEISGADMRRRSSITRTVLDHLAEVDRNAQPWLGAVRALLGSASLRRRVKSAYGGSP
jgi:hypothetical protein